MRDDTVIASANPLEEAVVVRLASQVVALIAQRGDADDVRLRDDLADNFEAACVDPDPKALQSALDAFRRHRVSNISIADIYIPHVAGRLGQGWLDDRISFADVTFGTARLQSLLRKIAEKWDGDVLNRPDHGLILFVVPRGEQHTLGALLTMGKLRRQGVSVCLRLAPMKDDLVRLFRSHRFDGVFVSLSSTTGVANCARMIKRMRAMTGGDLPFVVGGAIAEFGPDLRDALGATVITNDPDTALEACGLLQQRLESRKSA